jgi:hypothetical protein
MHPPSHAFIVPIHPLPSIGHASRPGRNIQNHSQTPAPSNSMLRLAPSKVGNTQAWPYYCSYSSMTLLVVSCATPHVLYAYPNVGTMHTHVPTVPFISLITPPPSISLLPFPSSRFPLAVGDGSVCLSAVAFYGISVWSKPMGNGTAAVLFVNLVKVCRTICRPMILDTPHVKVSRTICRPMILETPHVKVSRTICRPMILDTPHVKVSRTICRPMKLETPHVKVPTAAR